MDNEQLQALLKRPIKDIKPELASLDRATLVSLLAIEAEVDNPREALTKAITARIESIDNLEGDDADATSGDEAETPAWQRPEYTGTLTIDQATWRNLNLKPVTGVVEK